MSERVLIVGAGHAGTTLAGLLRQAGHSGPIELFGDEMDPPYHRPPLSKKFTGGELEQWLRPAEFYREQDITLRLGEQIVAVDRAAGQVRAASGGSYGYDYLVLATGARPRPLPVSGVDLEGVVSLRTLADARILRQCVADQHSLAIVGGGYIGLEVAAVARRSGVEITVVEREERVLCRIASPLLSEILCAHHRGQGTRIVTGAQVTRLDGADGRVRAVVLDDGTKITCDAVLVGVGAVPRDELAAAAGLHCDQGIVVDEHARTSDPHVLAIGDATRRPLATRASVRLESIPSATEQARQAVATIVGGAAVLPEVPWFWSDQFDLKLKIAGLVPRDADTVVRGNPDNGRFTLFHHGNGILDAVESANSPAEFMAGKKFIASGARIDPERLADGSIPLRDAVIH